ncbi:hypothetical protein HNY73_010967 [Argiope bruennichi]|uniref:Uncharacterized protein n=1 Tax=Argiope bruennichi TaxID=94029 RepID=A0A8T0F4S8_ARGBR|nr:hypothetical protein HNY73_010967 [Argiope bruennichi]
MRPPDLPALYDELEGKISALESLGRTQEKYSEFLCLFVESCLPEEILPEEILLAWERSQNERSLSETKDPRTLEVLMNFIRQEVKGEQMINLARAGFGPQPGCRRRDNYRIHNEQLQPIESTTASALKLPKAIAKLEERFGREDFTGSNIRERLADHGDEEVGSNRPSSII